MAEGDAGAGRHGGPEERPRRLPRHYRRIRPGLPAPRDGEAADRRSDEDPGDED
ncbi:hypothetical protein ACI79C_05950 [Geodermatophilus sp. SYSU D00697]